MNVFIAVLAAFFFVLLFLLVRHRSERRKKKKARREREVWSIGMYRGTTPYDLADAGEVDNPVLTARDVHDVKARFVADPFMLMHEDRFHLFFEVLNGSREKGEIGYATSDDTKRWVYRGIVLRERFHLSFPYVFTDDGNVYMIPECADSGGIQLYRAESFPVRWARVATLVKGTGRYAPLYDASIVKHEGRWYLFSYARKVDNLHLFSADTLLGPWSEHPRSPVVSGTPHYARPAGRIVAYGKSGELVRFAQDGIPNYGSKVWAFTIMELSKHGYREEPAKDVPVIAAGRETWNRKGMHTVDAHFIGGRWIAAVDGLSGEV